MNLSATVLALAVLGGCMAPGPGLEVGGPARSVESKQADSGPADLASTGPAPVDSVPVDSATASLTWGQDESRPSSSWTKPAIGIDRRDPVYGANIRRLTSADGTRFDRNTYSRRQAENADGTLFLTYHGSATYHVYAEATGSLVRELDISADAEPQWHPTDPAVIRHMAGAKPRDGDLSYYETNIRSGQRTKIADLTDRVIARFPTAGYMIDRAEGSPSADGNRVAWIVFDSAEQPLGIVHYDLSADRIIGLAPVEDGVGLLDWVSSSPTGSYVVAGYESATVLLEADLTNRRLINSKGDHSDMALSRDGQDTYVDIDFSAGPDGGWLVSVDLASNERTRLFDLYGTTANTSVHISGKGYNKPGWVVVSTYNCKVEHAWSCQKVMAVELAGEHRILNLAHTYNCGTNYWTETQAVVNRDFTRIYFNSDGGSCGIDAEVYQLRVPSFS